MSAHVFNHFSELQEITVDNSVIENMVGATGGQPPNTVAAQYAAQSTVAGAQGGTGAVSPVDPAFKTAMDNYVPKWGNSLNERVKRLETGFTNLTGTVNALSETMKSEFTVVNQTLTAVNQKLDALAANKSQ